MIGIHDYATFHKCRNKFYNLFSGLWRTQISSFYNTKNLYLDIRVRISNGDYIFCHGLADLDSNSYQCLHDLITVILWNVCDSVKFRLVLERGDDFDEKKFIMDTAKLIENVDIDSIIIKKGWKILKPTKYGIVDYTNHIWEKDKSLWYNIKHHILHFKTLKKLAHNNPKITKEMVDDKNTVYFFDYPFFNEGLTYKTVA